MKKFEYMVGGFTPDVLDKQVQAKLNLLGGQGWELVSVAHNGSYVMFYLKREKVSALEAHCQECEDRRASESESGDGMRNAAEIAGLQ